MICTGLFISFHTPTHAFCGQMVHLILKFTKYQIYFSILPTNSKNFNGIKWVWSQPQPQRWSEFKFKIYTFIEYGFTQSDSNLLLDNVRQVNCLLKVFRVKKHFFTLIAATCHYPMDNIHEAISIEFLRIKHCLFIIVFNERETRCVNFELDL